MEQSHIIEILVTVLLESIDLFIALIGRSSRYTGANVEVNKNNISTR